MDCGGVFVKYVLFLFNILFVVCGILLIVFGSIVVSHIQQVGSLAQTFEANSIPIAILVLGCVIFIISFLGCCGAIREETCCTLTYSVFMLVLLLAQVALIVLVWTQHTKFLNYMNQIVATIWKQHTTDPKVMDALQLTFDCCGQNGSTDYTFNLESIPNSCCGANAISCNMVEAMKKPGCAQAFTSFWDKSLNIVRYAGLGVAAVELVAFIFACCLANQVRNERRRANY
ncbi:23 kDa integral membrane protein-like [Rhagoletis pomonella]|uniref:23 kDa integral membrane protein-like n=1 Tax=Rhagoletis pomonella TaxID=28610 RepID=UPI00177BA1DB|nr:23 kDa integral membrane protein-like [Rhagoletis pomonella]